MSQTGTATGAESTSQRGRDGHPPADLTAFQVHELRLVERLDDPHGLAVKEELEDCYEEEIHHGRLYPNLDTLVDKGLVNKRSKDQRTNEYEITRRGRRVLDAYRNWLDNDGEEEA